MVFTKINTFFSQEEILFSVFKAKDKTQSTTEFALTPAAVEHIVKFWVDTNGCHNFNRRWSVSTNLWTKQQQLTNLKIVSWFEIFSRPFFLVLSTYTIFANGLCIVSKMATFLKSRGVKLFVIHNGAKSRVLLLHQIWIINYYVKCLSENLSNENKNTGVSREIVIQNY